MLICSSPRLIAACHVLHRLLMPRHSPCALSAFVPGKFLCSVLALCLELLEFHNKFFSLVVTLTREKVFSLFFVMCFFFHLAAAIVVAYLYALPKFLERLIISYLSSESVRFTQFFFLYSIFNEHVVLYGHRPGWIRTIDLALIRRAL